MDNLILANIVRAFHFIVVVFITLVPFTWNPGFLLLNSVFIPGILFHWIVNSDICALTIIEQKLRGLQTMQDGFIYQFIGPIFTMNRSSFSKVLYVLLIVLWAITIYKLWSMGVYQTLKQRFLGV